MKVCLLGNPNCGKSTIYNLLTGSNVSVGNWSGVTVKGNIASLKDSSNIEIIDLPGIYSLSEHTTSLDEQVAINFVNALDYDLIINVIDSANLQKSLFLTLELLKLKKNVVIVLNMLDNLGKQGKALSAKRLSEELGVPVVEMVAKKGYGVESLKNCIKSNKHSYTFLSIQKEKQQSFIKNLIKNIVTVSSLYKRQFSDKVDDYLLGRYLGLPLFFCIMFFVFSVSIYFGTFLQDIIADFGQSIFIDWVKVGLSYYNAPAWLALLLADGFGGGIILVLQFIPIIAILYLLLSVLEESGYISRAAFILDKVMSWFGMSGKAFLPMITGFGCNVPSIITTRILENPKERIAAAMTIPFMSCGARLPVYVLFCAAFFPKASGVIIFSLYAFGIFVAFITSLILKAVLKNTERAHLVMELPSYNIPEVKSVLRRVYIKVKDFVFNAGKLILVAFILLKFGSQISTNFSVVSDSSDESILAFSAKGLTPLFSPIGITNENWPAVVGIITGAVAKEAVIGSLGALYLNIDYNIEDEVDPKEISVAQKDKIINSMQSKFQNKIAVYAYLLFILLYFPCVSTFAILAKEFSYKWAVISMTWSTSIAYVVAMLFYQFGRLIAL